MNAPPPRRAIVRSEAPQSLPKRRRARPPKVGLIASQRIYQLQKRIAAEYAEINRIMDQCGVGASRAARSRMFKKLWDRRGM